MKNGYMFEMTLGFSYFISTPTHARFNNGEREGASCEQITGTAV